MRWGILALAVLASLALGVLGGVVVSHSAAPRTSTVTVAGAVTTVRAPTRTVTHVVIHTHAVTTPAAPSPTTTESAAPTSCNDLPASGSATLTEIRESRCEMEKLNAENPSAASEREIETLISDERAIAASG